jgi:hypothetical protein
MHESTASADLSYLKRLAQAGRGGPAPFLPLMAVFGLAYGLCLLLIYGSLVIDGTPDGGGIFYPWSHYAPLAAHIAFLLTAAWTLWRLISSRGRGLSRTASAAWSGAFFSLVTIFAALRLYTQHEPPSDAVYTGLFLPSILLTLWGAAWWVSALSTDKRFLLIVAVSSFAAAIAAAIIGNTTELLLLAALSLLTLAFVPAAYLMWTQHR